MREGLPRGVHEEAEIQRKALRRGKNLAFSEDTCLEKKKSPVKGNPKKSWSRVETEAAPASVSE